VPEIGSKEEGAAAAERLYLRSEGGRRRRCPICKEEVGGGEALFAIKNAQHLQTNEANTISALDSMQDQAAHTTISAFAQLGNKRLPLSLFTNGAT